MQGVELELSNLLARSGSPAPVIKTAPTHVSYDEVADAARCSVLCDLRRQLFYRQQRDLLRRQGAQVQVIKVSDAQADRLVRSSSTRLMKDYVSASWGMQFYQASLFGLTGITSVATLATLYMGIFRKRLLLPFVPVMAAMTWRLWNTLEAAWVQKRYIDNAARARAERTLNPADAVVRRRAKTEARAAADAEAHEAAVS